MENSTNYLVDFSYKLDHLISEINRLNSKTRLYKQNSKKFGYEFSVKLSISPEYFEKLRKLLHEKIDEGSFYNRDLANLKREFLKSYNDIILKIKREISRINRVQEKEMNAIVYKAIYDAKYNYEMNLAYSCDVPTSLIDKFLGIHKNKKLMKKNHELKAELAKKKYENEKNIRKNIFELVTMIENADVKSGELLCLEEDIIKYFMLDKNTIKRTADFSWKISSIIPYKFFEKRNYYKQLNLNIEIENKELKAKLNEKTRLEKLSEKTLYVKTLKTLNEKLSKIINSATNYNS